MRYRMKCWIAQANKTVRPLGFHIFRSNEGRFYASHSRSIAEMTRLSIQYRGLWVGSGETLDAPTLREIVAKIQQQVAAG